MAFECTYAQQWMVDFVRMLYQQFLNVTSNVRIGRFFFLESTPHRSAVYTAVTAFHHGVLPSSAPFGIPNVGEGAGFAAQ